MPHTRTITVKVALLLLASFIFITSLFSAPALAQVGEPIIELPERILLKNFYYLNADSSLMERGEYMLIEGGIITSINLPESLCARCKIIDLEGGYLIPGLMDLHQHLNLGGFAKESPEQKIALLRRNLYWGITTVFNPSIPLPLLRVVRKAAKRNPERYPEVFAAGQNIDVPGGWGDRGAPHKKAGATVTDLQEFKTLATRQLAASANIITVSNDDMRWLSTSPLGKFPLLLLRQATALMHTNKQRLFVQTAQEKRVQDALTAKADAIINGTVDSLLDEPIIRYLTAKQVGYLSTLAYYETVADVAKSVAAQQKHDPDLVNSAHIYTNMGSELMVQNWRDWWSLSDQLTKKLPTVRGNTLALVKAGALVGIGTDAGTPGVIFGASLAYEMHLHEQLGLAPLAVIQMASLNNAKILKIADRTGSIATGKEADLVLLRSDPTGGIKALKALEWTMQNGVITYRRELTAPDS